MFRKLVSNLPFSPSLIEQLGFYAKRLKKEQAIRRLGVIFTVFALIMQSFAIFTPPESANAASDTDILRGGCANKQCILDAYDSNRQDFRTLIDYLGITRAELANAAWHDNYVIRSKDYAASFGRRPTNGKVELKIGDLSFWYGPLSVWDTGSNISTGSYYQGMKGTSAKAGNFVILKNCGNPALEYPPTPPAPPPPPTPVYGFDLEKSANKTTADPGDAIAYTLTFKNTGDTKLTNVKINDVLPEHVTYNNDLGVNPETNFSGDLFGDGLIVPEVAAGAEIKITFSVTITETSPDPSQCEIILLENQSIATSREKVDEDDKTNNRVTTTVAWECNCANSEFARDNPDYCQMRKSAVNSTQGGVDATTTTANGGDVITYTISVVNDNPDSDTVTIEDILNDVLEYADLVDFGGATFDQSTSTLSWQDIPLAFGESTTRNFTVVVKNPVPAMAQGESLPTSYDCYMSNDVYNRVDIKVNCPPQKEIIEQVIVEQLPATGPGENMIFGGILAAIVVFFYARSRQLGKEVRLVRKDFNTGTL